MLNYYFFLKKEDVIRSKKYFYFLRVLFFIKRKAFLNQNLNLLNVSKLKCTLSFFINKRVFFKKNKKQRASYIKFFFFKKKNEFSLFKSVFLNKTLLKGNFVFFIKKKNKNFDDLLFSLV